MSKEDMEKRENPVKIAFIVDRRRPCYLRATVATLSGSLDYV